MWTKNLDPDYLEAIFRFSELRHMGAPVSDSIAWTVWMFAAVLPEFIEPENCSTNTPDSISCGLFSVATDGVTDTPSVATLSTLNNPQYCVIKKFKKINWPARTRANWFLDTVKPEHVELSDQSAAN